MHFVKLAQRGRHPGASSGEKACHTLAKALRKVGDDMMILDSTAIEGFADLCRAAGGPFATGAQKDTVYGTIERAGK